MSGTVLDAWAIGTLAARLDQGGAGWTDGFLWQEMGRPTTVVKGFVDRVEVSGG